MNHHLNIDLPQYFMNKLSTQNICTGTYILNTKKYSIML